jgi:hypothetical protein
LEASIDLQLTLMNHTSLDDARPVAGLLPNGDTVFWFGGFCRLWLNHFSAFGGGLNWREK